MTNEQIKTVGQIIAQETTIGGNTAARVGGVVEGIGVALDNKDAAIGYFLGTISGGSIYVNAPNYLLGSGGNLKIKMPAAATSACTLTIGNAQAVQLWYNGAAVSSSNTWDAGEIVSVYYDGTRFMASNSQGGAKFSGGQKVSDITLEQTLGSGVNSVVSQKGVSDAVFNEIDINDIDDLKNLADALNPSSSLKPTYYTVTAVRGSVVMKVGSMAVISDNLGHVVTEIMSTHYLLDTDGYLTDEHDDSEVFTIFRSVKGNGGTLPTSVGTWTAWKYINQSVWPDIASVEQRLLAMMGYYVCDTAAGIADKTVSASGYALTNGGCLRIKMTNANTADNATLNINSTGAKALFYDGAQASSANTWEAGETLEVYYDGTQYQCVSGGGGKFATGEKVKEISLLDNLDSSGNLPKSSAIMDFLQPLITETSTNVTLTNEVIGVQISNGKWISQSQRHIYLIPYTHHNGDSLHIKGNATNGSYYAFLASDSHTVGSDVPFCISGQKEWTSVSANQITEEVIPSTCTYIAINRAYNSGDGFVPAELKVVNKSITDLDELQQQIGQNSEYIQQLGSACENQGGSIQEEVYASIGTWDANTGAISTSYLKRANLKIAAIGVNSITVTIPSGYYANFYYVNAANVSQGAVLVDWLGVGTVNLELNGLYDLMLNIKYGSAGKADITAVMLAQAPFVVTKSVMSGYDPAAPLSQLEGLEENIAPIIINTKDYDSWDNSGNPQNIRVRFIYTGIAGAVVTVTANSGYSFGIAVYSTTTPTGTAIHDSGWQTGSFTYNVPSSGVGCMTINTAKGNRTVQISYNESVANISHSVVLGNRSVTDNAVENSGDLITSGGVFSALYGGGNFTYRGNRVVLESYSFKGVEYMAVSAPSGAGQGAGVYGNYFIQGGAGGHVRVYDLTTKAIVANSINLSVVDSTNHVNNICFSKLFPTGNADFPYMYVSECTGQGRCFVENFTLNGSTLVQTLSYSGTDLHDTNWVLDYDRGYIYLLGNTESSYTVNGNKVRVKKFALPLPTDGDVVFTSDDVLDTFDMDGSDGQAYVFQGNIISNGKMYSCFGGSQTTHRIWINDLDSHILETSIELDQMHTGECESINIWEGTILIGYPNQSKLYQLIF